MPYALLAIVFASIVLASVTSARFVSFYGAVLGAQVLFYLLAGVGAVIELAARRRDEAVAHAPSAEPVHAPHAAREVA
jgi:hypothetical protein